jgi:hypothetical protein
MARASSMLAAMIARVGVDEDGLRVHGRQHLFDIGEEQLRIEVEFAGVAVRELRIAFGDADDLNVAALEGGTEKTGNVSMHESDDGDAQGPAGGLSRGLRKRWKRGREKDECDEADVFDHESLLRDSVR